MKHAAHFLRETFFFSEKKTVQMGDMNFAYLVMDEVKIKCGLTTIVFFPVTEKTISKPSCERNKCKSCVRGVLSRAVSRDWGR